MIVKIREYELLTLVMDNDPTYDPSTICNRCMMQGDIVKGRTCTACLMFLPPNAYFIKDEDKHLIEGEIHHI